MAIFEKLAAPLRFKIDNPAGDAIASTCKRFQAV
nr:MAG TPA: hypothetical protein [Caudoviricetes sp.]